MVAVTTHVLRIVVCGVALALAAQSALAAGPVLNFTTPEGLKVKVMKPEAERFFNMENLRPEYKLELRESFLPQVLEAVQSKPF